MNEEQERKKMALVCPMCKCFINHANVAEGIWECSYCGNQQEYEMTFTKAKR